jgi:hypothetical protein
MKKSITYIAVIILLMELTSCYTYRDLSNQQDYEKLQNKRSVRVLEVLTEQDITISFTEEFPGKMSNGKVGVGQAFLPYNKDYSILLGDNKTKYINKNDVRYEIISQDTNGFYCLISDIPFSEIKQMQIKKISSGKTILCGLGVGLGVVGITIGLTQF